MALEDSTTPRGRPQSRRIGPNFEDVLNYAATTAPDGSPALDARKLQELEGRFGYNGGAGCDVQSGPCSCGAWH